MAVKIDTLVWDLTIEDKNLEAGFKRVQTKMKNLGKQVVSDLNKIFSDFNVVNNAIRPKKGSGFISARQAGKEIGEDFLKGLEDEFKTRGTKARELLFRGKIGKKEFEKQGRIAGNEFNTGLLIVLKQLRSRGALTKDLERDLVASLKDTGQAGGRAFGQSFQKTILQSFFKIQRVLRLAFAGGILSLMTLVSRRVINTFRGTARAINTILTKAGDITRVRQAFAALTTSVSIAPASLLAKAREATAGLVNDLNLIKQLNFALQAGLPATEDQLARLAFAARRLGESVGRDATEAFQRLVNAIVKQERRVLDELGIVVRFQKAHKDWAQAMGITGRALTTQETILANLTIVSAAAEQAVLRLGVETDDVGKKFQRLKTNVENAKLELLEIVNNSGAVLSVLDRLGTKAGEFGDKLEENSIQIQAELNVIIVKAELAARRFAQLSSLAAKAGGFAARAFKKVLLPIPEELEPFSAGLRSIGETEESAFAKFEESGKFQARVRARQEEIQQLTTINDVHRERSKLQRELNDLVQAGAKGLIDQTVFIEKQKVLQEAINAALSTFNVLVAKQFGEDPPTAIDAAEQKRIDAARERVKLLEEEIALLQTFGATTLAGISAAPLKAIASEILQINRQIRDTETLLKTAQISSDEAEARLTELRDRRDELGKQKFRFDTNPELLIKKAAEDAKEAVDALVGARRLLAVFGVEFIADLPPQAAEVATKLQNVQAQIKAVKAEIETAPTLSLEKALGFELGLLQRQQGELKKLAANLQLVGLVLRDFPDLKARFFAGLDPETLIKLSKLLRDVAAGSKELAAAREALAVAEKKGKEKLITAARERVAEAIANNTQKNQELEAVLVSLGLTEEQRIIVLGIINDLLAEQDDKTSNLLKNLRGLRSAVRGILALADAFGILDRQTRLVLAGIDNILGGILQLGTGLASGNPFQIFGGIVQGLGGLARIFSGIFGGGPSPEEQKAKAEFDKLIDSLNRLSRNIDALRDSLFGLPGDIVAAFDKVLGSLFAPGEARFTNPVTGTTTTLAGAARTQLNFEEFQRAIDSGLISIDDLIELAQKLGIPIDTLIRVLQGEGEINADIIRIAAAELDKLREAWLGFTRELFNTFKGQLDLLETEFALFDIDKPLDQLKRFVDLLIDPAFVNLPDNLLNILQEAKRLGLDTPEGRAKLQEFIAAAFAELSALNFGAFGKLTAEEFKEALLKTEGFLDAIEQELAQADGEGTTESAIIRKSITEVTGNRMVGVLTTIAIINQGILAIVKEILLEMGGTLPTNLQAITFRAPATQLDILEIEQQQLNVLVEIRDLLGSGSLATTAPVPVSVEDIPFVPDPGFANPPRFTANVTIENPQFSADINTTGGVTVEDAREFARQAGVFLVEEVDVALGKSVFRRTTRNVR